MMVSSDRYGRPVEDLQKPWKEYRRDRLSRGWTYVFSRDVVESALREAGAQLRSLSLGRPDLPPRSEALSVFDVYFYGDSRPGSFSARTPRAELLQMRWTAVPVQLAPAISEEVRQVWLPRGCAWAAAALNHGNTWAAGEHRWRLVHEQGVLRLIET